MDGNSVNYTRNLEKFSEFAPEVWKRFETTKDYKYLEELSLYVPEKYEKEYTESFKEYMNKLHRDVFIFYTGDEDEIRETRKEA